jgi:hypothetical protein
VDIRECTFPASELGTLKAEIRAVSIQLFSTRSAVDGGEKLIRVYHGDGYIDIRQETIEQPQWRQLRRFSRPDSEAVLATAGEPSFARPRIVCVRRRPVGVSQR